MKRLGKIGMTIFGSAFLAVLAVQTAFADAHWIAEGDRFKYEGADGTLVRDNWLEESGLWYHFDENGFIQTGWVKGAEGWYYFGLDGSLNTATSYYDSQGRSVQPASGDGTYFMDGSQYLFNPETDGNPIFLSGHMNDTRVIAALKGVLAPDALSDREAAAYHKARTFLDTHIAETDNNEEKARKIFDYLKGSAVYQDTGKQDDDCPYSILVDGIGICGGYARTFKVLANGAGLECRYIVNGDHAYNEVFTDEWKWIDASSTINGADFYLKAVRYHCDVCGASGILPPRNYYTCPCGNTFGADN